MKGRLPFVLGVLVLLGVTRTESQGISIREASGITHADAALLVVSDEEAGVYYRLSLPESHGPVVPVHPGRMARIELPQARLALALEAIDVLADGRVVVLSERLRTFVAETGWEGLGWFEEGRSLVLIHDEPPRGQPTAVVVEIPDERRSAEPPRAGFSHLVRRNTPYYLDGPQQARPPEGTLPAGTRARVVREAGSHSLVETESGIAAYVSSDALLAGSPGLIVVEPPWHVLRGGAIRVTAVYADGPAWLVVHKDDNGWLGDRLGHARLEKGWNTGVTVQLEPGPTAPTKVWAVYYTDRQTIGVFEPGQGPGARGTCEGPDRPDVICGHHLGFLPDACLKAARAFECSDGLPIGTLLFTAVP